MIRLPRDIHLLNLQADRNVIFYAVRRHFFINAEKTTACLQMAYLLINSCCSLLLF